MDTLIMEPKSNVRVMPNFSRAGTFAEIATGIIDEEDSREFFFESALNNAKPKRVLDTSDKSNQWFFNQRLYSPEEAKKLIREHVQKLGNEIG